MSVPALSATLAVVALLAIAPGEAAAEIYRPWCVGYTATISNSCTFASFEQCMETARGGGGSCMQIPGTCITASASRLSSAPGSARSAGDRTSPSRKPSAATCLPSAAAMVGAQLKVIHGCSSTRRKRRLPAPLR
jgi:hypothetical protein